MTTLNDAEAARDAHAERLRRRGAHALAVKQVTRQGKKSFVVVALFADHLPPALPKALPITRGGKQVSVELVAKIASPFQPD